MAGVIAAIAVVGAAGLALPGSGTVAGDNAKPPHTPYTVLTAGTYQRVAWELFASEQEGHLCLELLPGGSDPDHLATSPPDPAVGGGGCEFDTHDPSGGYFTGSIGPGNSSVSFGPLPTDATQIRVAAHEILPTTPLPRSSGLPAGRYWIDLTPAGWPTPADGPALDTPQPLNWQGQPVDFQDF